MKLETRIMQARKRLADEERRFEELTIEARKWSDQHLWVVAARWFMKAANKAKDASFAAEDLRRLEEQQVTT